MIRFEQSKSQFAEGFTTSGSLLSSYLQKWNTQLQPSDSDSNVVDNKMVETIRSECLRSHINHLSDNLLSQYVINMEKSIPTVYNFEEFEKLHKAERAKALEIFNSTICSRTNVSVSLKKEFQSLLRNKKSYYFDKLKETIKTKLQLIYETNYHLLSTAKTLSTSQMITLTDASSPYSNLVAFKNVLSGYLSACKLQMNEIGVADEEILAGILNGEMKDIIEKSRYWVEGYASICNDSLSKRNGQNEALEQLKLEEKELDDKIKFEEESTEKLLVELEQKLTDQRIAQSSELEEKSTKLEVLLFLIHY